MASTAQIDASIPLRAVAPKLVSPAEAISLQQLARQNEMGQIEIQEARRKQQEGAELRRVLSGPGATTQDGMVSPTALSEITRINPQTAMQIQQQQNQRIAHAAQQRLAQLNVTSKQNDLIEEALTGVYAGYQRVKGTAGPEAGASHFRTTWGQRIDELEKSGNFTPDQIAGMRRVQSPDMVEGVIGGSKAYREWVNTREREAAGKQAEERAKRDETRLRLQEERGERDSRRLEMSEQRTNAALNRVANSGDKSPYTNIQSDGKGGFVGLNKKTGRMEKIQADEGVSSKGGEGRVIPAPIVRGYTENSQALRKINAALDAVEEYPDAFGLKNMLGDTIRQRTDPAGVNARALAADIGSLKIHDRSGAAVTAAEFPRLKPFVPNVNDTAETIEKKLKLFKKEYEEVQRDLADIYSSDQGYKALPTGGDYGRVSKKDVESSGWKFEPSKYEYRMNDGKLQRKARGG